MSAIISDHPASPRINAVASTLSIRQSDLIAVGNTFTTRSDCLAATSAAVLASDLVAQTVSPQSVRQTTPSSNPGTNAPRAWARPTSPKSTLNATTSPRAARLLEAPPGSGRHAQRRRHRRLLPQQLPTAVRNSHPCVGDKHPQNIVLSLTLASFSPNICLSFKRPISKSRVICISKGVP